MFVVFRSVIFIGSTINDFLFYICSCARLGLISLSYMWRRDQSELLQEMIDCGVNAIIIKTASLGLNPDLHLGRSIAEMQSHLMDSVRFSR